MLMEVPWCVQAAGPCAQADLESFRFDWAPCGWWVRTHLSNFNVSRRVAGTFRASGDLFKEDSSLEEPDSHRLVPHKALMTEIKDASNAREKYCILGVYGTLSKFREFRKI